MNDKKYWKYFITNNSSMLKCLDLDDLGDNVVCNSACISKWWEKLRISVHYFQALKGKNVRKFPRLPIC